MKKKIKTISLSVLLLIVVSVPKTYAQPTENPDFASALNKIIAESTHDFNSLKGEVFLSTKDSSWLSTEKLPGYDDASVNMILLGGEKRYSWESTMMKTTDSVAALKKYSEIAKMIMNMKLDCCSLVKKELSTNAFYQTDINYWTVASLNSGKDKDLKGLSITLKLRHPYFMHDDYMVVLSIDNIFKGI